MKRLQAGVLVEVQPAVLHGPVDGPQEREVGARRARRAQEPLAVHARAVRRRQLRVQVGDDERELGVEVGAVERVAHAEDERAREQRRLAHEQPQDQLQHQQLAERGAGEADEVLFADGVVVGSSSSSARDGGGQLEPRALGVGVREPERDGAALGDGAAGGRDQRGGLAERVHGLEGGGRAVRRPRVHHEVVLDAHFLQQPEYELRLRVLPLVLAWVFQD